MHIKSYAASRAVDVEQKKGNETEQQGKILKFDSFLAIFNHSFLCSVGGCNRPPPLVLGLKLKSPENGQKITKPEQF